MLPGVLYDVNHQCRLQYGPSSAYCEDMDVSVGMGGTGGWSDNARLRETLLGLEGCVPSRAIIIPNVTCGRGLGLHGHRPRSGFYINP